MIERRLKKFKKESWRNTERFKKGKSVKEPVSCVRSVRWHYSQKMVTKSSPLASAPMSTIVNASVPGSELALRINSFQLNAPNLSVACLSRFLTCVIYSRMMSSIAARSLSGRNLEIRIKT